MGTGRSREGVLWVRLLEDDKGPLWASVCNPVIAVLLCGEGAVGSSPLTFLSYFIKNYCYPPQR